MSRTEYVRKSFTVVAEEVTFENVHQVAEWCKGKVVMESTKLLGTETKLPVILLKGQGDNRGKEFKATLGCFVVELKGSFRVYKNAQFFSSFEKAEHEDKEKYVCVNAVDLFEKDENQLELTPTEKIFGKDSLVARSTKEALAEFEEKLSAGFEKLPDPEETA